MNTNSHFTIDDIQKHIEAVQNDIAKRENKVEILNPLIVGACVGCGAPLIDLSDPMHMCSKCKEQVERNRYQLDKKKRAAQAKGKKMRNKHVLHINQIGFLDK